MRFRGVLGCVVLAVLVSACVASAASMPAGGAVRFFVTPAVSGGGGAIVVAGAIGDYGRVGPESKKGIGEAFLKKGTFKVNLAAVDKKVNSSPPIIVSKVTCSFVYGGTAPMTIMDGTGLYKRLSGTGRITEIFAGIGPRYKTGAKKGQCNMSNNANPIAQWGSVTATATVRFG